MNPDEFQQAWQAQPASRRRVTFHARTVLDDVRRKQQGFRRTIFWRDVREIGVAVLLIPMFVYQGLTLHWTLHLCAFSCAVVGGFMLLDRRRQRRQTPDLHESLTDCTLTSLAEVNHQIWLLKNVHWWYLLPPGVPVVLFFGACLLKAPGPVALRLLALCIMAGFVALLYAGIYWLNQRAVKKELEPRRRELEALLQELETEPHTYTMKKNKPLGPLLLVLLVCGVSFVAVFGSLLANEAPMRPTGSISDPTARLLEEIRIKHKFPALAAAVVVDGKIVATNALGFRKHGGTESVTLDDKFHLGSVTKSMTATVAAMLVEQGKISWTTTIGDAFSAEAADLHADYRGVTLEQLLAHRGGAPANAPRGLWSQAWKADGPPAEGRRAFVKGILARRPETQPGTKMVYSNQGYAIAGVMLEQAAGRPWEELMRTLLFEPLGMNSAGFGAPATPGRVDQPWGHTKKALTGVTPVPPGPGADNPPAIGPAGRVHCSLPDLARYVQFHLGGEGGASDLLQPASFKKLHTAAGDDYALGWVVLKRSWAGGRALMHNGSNTMFYVVVWMAPERNCAVIVATNIGGAAAAFSGCDEAAWELIQRFFPK